MSGVTVTASGGWADDLRKAAFRAVQDLGEHALALSNDDAPIEEGTMIRTGQVSSDEKSGTVQISYDGPYVVRQHEDVRLRHDNGRKAKFLEDVMVGDIAPTAEQYIGAAVKKAAS